MRLINKYVYINEVNPILKLKINKYDDYFN